MTIASSHELIFMIGRPVTQTKSPALMNAWFADRGIACALVPLAVSDEGLRSVLELLRHGANVRGAVVTLPFKTAAAPHLDECAGTALALNAVNVIRKEADGRLSGDMLDGKAMLRALKARGLELRGQRVFLAGCGGAGSAMAYSACSAGAVELRLMDTDERRAAALASVLSAHFPDCHVEVSTKPEACDVLVNATPLGMLPSDSLPFAVGDAKAANVAIDAVTCADTTPWVAACRALGMQTVNGNELAAAQQPLLLEFFGFA